MPDVGAEVEYMTIHVAFEGLTWEQEVVAQGHMPPPGMEYMAQVDREFESDKIRGKMHGAYVISCPHPFADPDEGNAEFAGQQIFTGVICGRRGSFTAYSTGRFDGFRVDAAGDLVGISGEGQYTIADARAPDPVKGAMTLHLPRTPLPRAGKYTPKLAWHRWLINKVDGYHGPERGPTRVPV